MRKRAGVLAELARAQTLHILNPLYWVRALIGAEFLLAINGQAFLQTELKPVAASDAVAGPVVEVFVADDRLDRFEIRIRRRFRVGEDQR